MNRGFADIFRGFDHIALCKTNPHRATEFRPPNFGVLTTELRGFDHAHFGVLTTELRGFDHAC